MRMWERNGGGLCMRESKGQKERVQWEAIRTADQEIDAAKLVFTSSAGPLAQLRWMGD